MRKQERDKYWSNFLFIANKQDLLPFTAHLLAPGQAAHVFYLTDNTLRPKPEVACGLGLHEKFENRGFTSSPTIPETHDQGKKLFPKPHREPHLSKLTYDVNSHPERPCAFSHSSCTNQLLRQLKIAPFPHLGLLQEYWLWSFLRRNESVGN